MRQMLAGLVLTMPTEVVLAFADNLVEVVGRWTEFLSITGYSAKTTEGYEYWFWRYVTRSPKTVGHFCVPPETSEDCIVAYLAGLPKNGHSRGGSLRALKSFYGYALARGIVQFDPTARLKIPRPKYGAVEAPSRDELIRLLVAATWRSERRGWAILLAAATGARRESLCNVEAEDVHGGYIHFRIAKGGKPYRVPLSHSAYAAVDGLMTSPRPRRGPTTEWRSKLVGVSPAGFWMWVSEAASDAGLKAHPHSLRHFFGSELPVGTDPRDWQELMNHSDLSQYARYRQPNAQRLREAVEAI